MSRTKATICIVESLEFLQEESHREGEIVARTLRLSEKPAAYAYVRTRAELEAFIKEFGESSHRYLHLSCHGSKTALYTTTDRVPAQELAAFMAPHVSKRRVFLSSCQGADSSFARTLLKQSDCWSVLAPVGSIRFDDAAIFWTAFYHIMFKTNPDSMNRADIERVVTQCATLVGLKFRLFYKVGDQVKVKSLGHTS
jgi:hypothetical protein